MSLRLSLIELLLGKASGLPSLVNSTFDAAPTGQARPALRVTI